MLCGSVISFFYLSVHHLNLECIYLGRKHHTLSNSGKWWSGRAPGPDQNFCAFPGLQRVLQRDTESVSELQAPPPSCLARLASADRALFAALAALALPSVLSAPSWCCWLLQPFSLPLLQLAIPTPTPRVGAHPVTHQPLLPHPLSTRPHSAFPSRKPGAMELLRAVVKGPLCGFEGAAPSLAAAGPSWAKAQAVLQGMADVPTLRLSDLPLPLIRILYHRYLQRSRERLSEVKGLLPRFPGPGRPLEVNR